MALESKVVDRIVATLLSKYGGFPFKTHGGQYQRRGMPDLLWWYQGHSFGFEVKRGSGYYKATALQEFKLAKLKAEGVHVGVVSSPEQVIEIVEEVLCR